MSNLSIPETDGVNLDRNETFAAVLQRRLSRRRFLQGALAGAPFVLLGPALLGQGRRATAETSSGLNFQPIELSDEDRVIVPPGYISQVLIRWGDPLHPDVPAFNVQMQTPALQGQQFGYNCDWLDFFPLPQSFDHSSRRGLLAVNHEYTNPELMFPGYVFGTPIQDQVDIEIAAHGLSVVEVVNLPLRGWQVNTASNHNRRITGETEIVLAGPVAGHEWAKVSYDSTGTNVRGMLNNCAGGKTPWGTILTCEENFHQYFANRDAMPDDDPRKAVHVRYGIPSGASERRWELYHPRFDLAQEPNEAFRFGWVVEIDPYDPHFTPIKRTALGRFRHEGATCVVSGSGRIAVYSGDDERFEYMYKFVTAGQFNARDRYANIGLLDAGTLYVARFNDDGTGEWLPLVFGEGPLTEAHGFTSQADVLLNTRGAADLLEATKMDRPEDIETNPMNGKVYCVMTNNSQRSAEQVDAANPRGPNRHGHIIELTEHNDDHTAQRFTWEIFILCGDPDNPDDGAYFAGFDPSLVSPISSPDNITFDLQGNLWIATDGQTSTFKKNDGVYAVPVEGQERGYLRQFLSGVPGGELASLTFSPNNHALFCSIQHPGEGSSLANPSSTWPDGTLPPRPSVIVVERTGGGNPVIGS
jgi:secreted PhoX family phosphatase